MTSLVGFSFAPSGQSTALSPVSRLQAWVWAAAPLSPLPVPPDGGLECVFPPLPELSLLWDPSSVQGESRVCLMVSFHYTLLY